jgi:hypothetical protein
MLILNVTFITIGVFMYININQVYKSALLGMFFWAMGAIISYISSMHNISNNWSGLAMFILVGLPSGFQKLLMLITTLKC